MAIIYSYPNGGSAIASDKLTISRSSLDAPIPNPTFTLTVAQIAAFVQNQLQSGTPNYIPVFNTSNTIIDSPLFLDDFTIPTLLTIGNNTKIQGNLTLEQDQADTTITIISDGSNIGEQHNPSIQFVQDGGAQNAAIGFNIIDDTSGGTIPGTGNRFWIVNAMDDTVGAGGITFGTAQVDGWDNAIARFMIRGDGKGLFGHPNANYTKTLDSQFEIYDDRTENSTSDYSLSVLGVADISDPGGSGGAGGIISRLSVVNGVTPISSHAIGMVTGTTSSEILATGDLAFFVGSDMDTSSATGFAGVIHDSGNWQIGGATSGDADPGYKLYVAGDTWISGALLDSGQNEGTAGQVLTSTGTGTAWAGGSTGTVNGTGINNYFPIWTDGPNGVIGDSQLRQGLPNANGLYQIRMENADRFIINKPSSVTSGDPEYLIQQDGNYKVSMGWDDDGDGFGFLYNWAGDGWRFGSAGNNPELTIVTTSGSEGVDIANDLRMNGNAIAFGDLTLENGLIDGDLTYGTAGQVLSTTGSGQNVKWVDTTTGAFKEVNEGNGLGIVKQSRNPNNYAPVGNEAFDASQSTSVSSTKGAEGDYAVALGLDVYARGNHSFAFGETSRAFNDWDIVMGHDSEAVGGNSVAIGWENKAQGAVSTAIGSFVTASGDNSIAFGTRLTATGSESNVFGKYNATTDELFVVGNGNNATPSDLIVGKENGVILAPSLDILEILDPKCLVTLEYISAISSGIIGTGTIGVMPVWTTATSLGDSVIKLGTGVNSLIFNDLANNIASGENSLAMGENTTASGENSSAMGKNSIASGLISTAMGLDSISSGNNSTAMGESTTASGESSIAMGKSTTASAVGSTAIGYKSIASGECSFAGGGISTFASPIDGGIAYGINSFAFGENAIAGDPSGNIGGDIAIGSRCEADGGNSVALGNNTKATRSNSFAAGVGNLASGSSSTALGSVTVASGAFAFACGDNTTASGSLSFAAGKGNVASGAGSIVMGGIGTGISTAAGEASAVFGGLQNNANGLNSTILGGQKNDIDVNSNDSSIIGGEDNEIIPGSKNSVLLGGIGLRAGGIHQTTCGVANTPRDDAKFIVGVGTYTSPTNITRENGFVVKDNGQIVLDQYINNDFLDNNANLEILNVDTFGRVKKAELPTVLKDIPTVLGVDTWNASPGASINLGSNTSTIFSVEWSGGVAGTAQAVLPQSSNNIGKLITVVTKADFGTVANTYILQVRPGFGDNINGVSAPTVAIELDKAYESAEFLATNDGWILLRSTIL